MPQLPTEVVDAEEPMRTVKGRLHKKADIHSKANPEKPKEA